jgi:membrane-bound serine protease (ClpP class)
MMNLLSDPNLVYLVLLFGLWLGVTAAYMPGTGLLELISIGATALGVVSAAQLGVNWVALVLLILGVTGFLVMPFIHQRYILLAVVGLVLQVVGSLFLLTNSPISPVLIAVTIAIALIYHYFALMPALKRSRATPVTDDDEGLIGAVGMTTTRIAPTGSVRVNGETWSARSDRELDAGDEVVVLERRGLLLYVEGMKHKRENQVIEEA